MMTIIDQEFCGKWDTNGVISPTNAYGLTQINKCNEEFIKENLGYAMNDILNGPFIAIEAQALLLNNIMKLIILIMKMFLEHITVGFYGDKKIRH